MLNTRLGEVEVFVLVGINLVSVVLPGVVFHCQAQTELGPGIKSGIVDLDHQFGISALSIAGQLPGLGFNIFGVRPDRFTHPGKVGPFHRRFEPGFFDQLPGIPI